MWYRHPIVHKVINNQWADVLTETRMWRYSGCDLIWTLQEYRNVWSCAWMIYKYLQSHRLQQKCEGSPFPRPRRETGRKKEGAKKPYQCKTKEWNRDLPERWAAAGQKRRTKGCSGEQEGGRDRERQRGGLEIVRLGERGHLREASEGAQHGFVLQ